MRIGMTPEAFQAWLDKGKDRAPNLYGGKVVHTQANGLAVAPKAIPKPLGEVQAKERLDWAKRAANDRESREIPESPGIPGDWDGREE